MKFAPFGSHSRLVFRSYLLLVAGLLGVAVTLQLGFEYLQSRHGDVDDTWPRATLDLVAEQLAGVSPGERDALAAELGTALGLRVTLLARDDVAGSTNGTLETLVDDDGNAWYLYAPAALDQLLYVGPLPDVREPWILRIVPALFYLSIFVLVGLWLRPLLADVDRITGAARAFAADYRTPLETAAQTTELTSLAADLDDMSARLSNLIQTQKELIAALSHEMRTPLARIRFALAVIDRKSDRDLSDQIDALNADVQEIDDLIATMLNYARLDHPDLQMHWQDVPVAAWLTQATQKFAEGDKALGVHYDNAPDTLRMDPRLMTLAVSSLLSNAQRYAAAEVRVGVECRDGEASIAVEDDGLGIPEADRETVFKAFTRLDDSRNRDTGGYGLGLAIVARIAALHGGSVRVDTSASLGGAAFVLRWPN